MPITLTGTASIGISVARQLCRKTNTTSATSSMASSRVTITSWMDTVTNGVVSNGMVIVTPGGRVFCSWPRRLTMASRVRSALAPGRRYSRHNAVGRPFSRPSKS